MYVYIYIYIYIYTRIRVTLHGSDLVASEGAEGRNTTRRRAFHPRVARDSLREQRVKFQVICVKSLKCQVTCVKSLLSLLCWKGVRGRRAFYPCVATDSLPAL